ncbi:MAG TPA: pilus assembly protein [Roseiflexaceae bacterium]|nr:pilus assembly protein [Roseiflexaceae bacterium]HMP43368.1 pilus assembly protein [Roseiflexaceae bacterium]
MNRHNRRYSGQAMVEMSVVLVLLTTLIFGAVSALQILMAKYTLAQAARVAAHQAALIGGDDGPEGTVTALARDVIDSGMGTRSERATISISCSSDPCRRYESITVSIGYRDELWVPIGPFAEVVAHASATRAAERDQQP